MGHIRLDERFGKPQLVFYVGNGQKEIPKLVKELDDLLASTIEAALTAGLATLRPALTQSEKFNGSSPG